MKLKKSRKHKKICGKSMRRAKNGVDRGTCTKYCGHRQFCSNETCFDCGVKMTSKNSPPSNQKYANRFVGKCSLCKTIDTRRRCGHRPRIVQRVGKFHEFWCGCSGVLQKLPNKFATYAPSNGYFSCRIAHILSVSSHVAAKRGFAPMQQTSHSVIRKMTEQPNCELCGESLKWEFGQGKTPHLHHDHETGEIYGFTHPQCNPRALEDEIDRLRKLLKRKNK